MSKKIKKFLNPKYDRYFLIVALCIFSALFSLIAVLNHRHFLTFGWDLGYFDQIVWKLSRFIYPYSTLNKINFWANHFSPVLFLYALLFRFHSSPETLLIAQSFIVVFAAYPLYLLASDLTGSRVFPLAVTFSYLFFLGTQWSILNEFHEATIVPLFLSLFFYAAQKAGIN